MLHIVYIVNDVQALFILANVLNNVSKLNFNIKRHRIYKPFHQMHFFTTNLSAEYFLPRLIDETEMFRPPHGTSCSLLCYH